MAEEIAKGGGIELSSDINVITAEINAYQRVAGEAIFEIGRRLHRVRYNPKEYGLPEGKDKHGNTIVARGYWGEWLAEMGIHTNVAHRTMTVYEEFSDGKMATSPNKGLSALYEIATLPPEQREQTHVTDKGEEKKPEDMTVRELRDLKRQLKAEQAERERLEEEATRLYTENAELSNRLEEVPKAVEPEVRVETRTEYVEVKDEYSEKRAEEAEARLREYEERFGDIRNYEEQITATHRQDMLVAVMSFSKGVREFAKRYSYMTEYEAVIANLDEESKRQYDEAVLALQSLGDSFKTVGETGEIIEAQYKEI